MTKTLKYFVYIVACAGVFVFLVRSINGNSISTETASAFEWEKTVSIYLINDKLVSEGKCSEVFPFQRRILNAEILSPGSLESLLKGPVQEDKDRGYSSAIADSVSIQKFDIKDGVAYVDLSHQFKDGLKDKCQRISTKSQIEKTLTVFPEIKQVVISVDNEVVDLD